MSLRFRLLPALAAVASLLPPRTAAYPVSPLPAFVRPAEAPRDALPPPDQASTGAYWQLYDVQQDIPTRQAYEHHALRVISEAGLSEASRISVDYEPSYEKILWHRITLWRNGKPTELLPRLKATEMRREEEWDWGLLDGRLTQLFSLEDVRVGDVVEFSRTLVGENPIFGDRLSGNFWFRFGMPIERLEYRVLQKAGRPLHVLALNGGPEPDTTRAGDRTVISWRADRVAAQVEDDDAPSWNIAYPRVQWSEYASWSQVVDWALPLYEVKGNLSPELEKVVKRLRKADPRERVRMALRLVQDDVRYLGLEMGASSHRPSHPDRVYARRFGDCKDKSLLFCALMRRAGVDADPVLVNSNSSHEMEAWRPSPLVFDHVIARVILEGKRYWFDPTMGHQRGDPLGNQSLDYGRGLPIVRGGGVFDTIRPAPEAGGRLDVHQAFVLDGPYKPASLEVTTTTTGAEADRVRALFANASREELSKTYLNYYARTYPAIVSSAPVRMEDDSAANVVIVRESYTVSDLCKPDGDRPSCWIYPGEIGHWVSEPDRRIRTSPYGLDFPKDIRQVITVEAAVPLEFGTDSQTVSHPDFIFSWKESTKGGKAIFAYTYRALNDHVPLERFPAYLAALDTIEDNLGTTLYPEGEGLGGSLEHPNHFIILWLLVSFGAGIGIAVRLRRIPPARLAPGDFLALPVGGGVTLLGLLVFGRPLMDTWMLWESSFLLDMDAWLNLTHGGNEGYHPIWFWLLVPMVGGTAAALACNIALVRLFQLRHRSFPRAFALTWAFEWLLGTWECFGKRFLPEGARGEIIPLLDWAGATMVAVLILAYVLKSGRVQDTFVFPLVESPASDFVIREKEAV